MTLPTTSHAEYHLIFSILMRTELIDWSITERIMKRLAAFISFDVINQIIHASKKSLKVIQHVNDFLTFSLFSSC